MSDDPFAELMTRVRAGDPDAATELVRRYEPLIRREVRLRLEDRRLARAFDSADVCQSVLASFFVRTAAGQYDLDAPEQLGRLLMQMARNKLASAARHQSRQKRDHRRAGGDEAWRRPRPTTRRRAGSSPGGELLDRFRARLNAEERRIADLRAEGLAWAEVAAQLGGTAQARRMQLARAADRAARELGLDEGDDMTPAKSGADPAGRYSLLWDAGGPDLDAFLSEAGRSPRTSGRRLRVDQRERWRSGSGFRPRVRPPVVGPGGGARPDLRRVLASASGSASRPTPRSSPTVPGPRRGAAGAGRAPPGGRRGHPGVPADPARRAAGPGGPAAAVRAVPAIVGARPRRDGDGLPGRRPPARPTGGAKVPRFDPARAAEASERFRREARAAGAVRHPNLCPVYDVGRLEGSIFLTMPHVAGESLSARLRGRAPSRPGGGPAGARHRRGRCRRPTGAGVVHRDLKPSNVLLDEGGEPVVTDFGLAQRVGPDDPRMTASGAVIGTPRTCRRSRSAAARRRSARRSDVYSLGVILYELLTGRPPFHRDAGEILMRVLSDDPAPPSRLRTGIDPRLEAACWKAIAKVPARRFGSMAEFADAVRPVAEGVSAPPSRRWAALLAVVGVVALAGVGVWLAPRSPDSGTTIPATDPHDPVADPFRIGSEWSGMFQFLPDGGRGPVSLHVRGRSGDAFDGVYQTDTDYRWEVSGKAGGGVIEWRLTKALTPQAQETGATGIAVVTGTYADGVMDVMYQDHDSRAKMTLRPGVRHVPRRNPASGSQLPGKDDPPADGRK